jgi:radical SAM superfamily enzyme YgiQ (UPF0313 family)
MVEIAKHEKKQVRGVYVARSGKVDLGRQAVVDFAASASPWTTGMLRPGRFARWESQRGCPFSCSFCQHRAPTGVAPQTLLASRIAEEIEILCDDSEAREIAVLDPTFNITDTHAIAVLNMFRARGYRGKLALQVRPEKLSPKFLDAVASFGPRRIKLEFGVQTAVPEELEIIDRVAGADPRRAMDKVSQKLALVREYGSDLETEVSLIFALPRQTVASFEGSISWCRDALPHAKLVAFPLMLLRGTALHARAKELGLVEGLISHPSISRVQDFIPHVVETPTMSREDWIKMAGLVF